MTMSDMNFGVNLVPTSNDTYSLGSANKQWKLFGHFAPLETKTYTNVIATSNDNNGAGFFYMRVRGTTYNTKWYIKTRVYATVPGQQLYETDSTFELWGYANTYNVYKCDNQIKSTSYRPIYYNSYFRVSSTGYTNNCGGWVGFNLMSSNNNTNTSYKRTIVVELLDYKNCEVQLQDSLITPTNIPNRSTHTDWYSSTNTSFDNFDAANQGLKQIGDNNTTTISRLNNYYTYYTTDSALYRYKMLFSMSQDRVTPLNNEDNVTGANKTILTNVEFDPFGRIYYYNSTTAITANSLINNSGPAFMYDLIDLRFTFNITNNTASDTVQKLTSNKNVYLKVIPLSNGKVKLASAAPLVQDLPVSEEPFLYILLGRQYDWYRMTLFPEHPVYKYYYGAIRECKPTMYVSEYTGDGSYITNIDAANIDTGTLSADRLATSGATAGTYGDSAAQTPNYGSTFKVPTLTVDNKGRVTAISQHTVKIPASDSPNITGKADKVSNATNGNFAALNSSGNLVDSGKKSTDFLPLNTLQFIDGYLDTSASGVLLRGVSNVSSLIDGHIIYYRIPSTISASTFSIQLTFSDNTTSSVYTIYESSNTPSEADYGQGAIISLVYNNSKMYILSSNVVNGMGVSF